MKRILATTLMAFALIQIGDRAYGDSCTDQDLNAPSDSPLRAMPIYDQDGSGTCYAHAASQLIDYYRIQHGASPDDRINPIYAAWVSSYQARVWGLKKNDTVGSSQAIDLINDVRTNGYCKEDRVESALNEFKSIGGFSDAELVHFLEAMYENYTFFTTDHRKAHAIRKTAEDSFLDRCGVQSLAQVLEQRDLMDVPATEIMEGLFKKCQPPTPLKIPEPVNYIFGSDYATQERINYSLDHQSPVAIGMCASVFRDHKYRGLNSMRTVFPRGANAATKSDCGGHEVLITARKKFPSGCKYLIRNSWGSLWHPSDVACACIKFDGSYHDNCAASPDVKAYVGCWYSREDLIPNTMDVTTFYGGR